jgi:5'-nucleotidase
MLIDLDGNVTTAGTRIVDVTLDDGTGTGTVIVSDGAVVPGPGISVATNDFSARGGDQWFHEGSSFTSVGVSYQQALSNYIQSADGLNGLISSADYPEEPEEGEERIIQLP